MEMMGFIEFNYLFFIFSQTWGFGVLGFWGFGESGSLGE
jgi:hypothetical protein